VNKVGGSLNDEDVRQIAQLVETLDRSGFDYLQLAVGQMTLTLSKGALPKVMHATTAVAAPVAAAVPPAVARPAPAPTAAPVAAPTAAPAATGKSTGAKAGTIDITAPLTGLFYRKPDPASAPFVSVGATVEAGATVALIEVMKVFNAVPATAAGVITEICAEDAQQVEAGQVLLRLRPIANPV
jgi:acetyl-CoA carboxylase biotin carboxyl carrier protein